MSWEIRGAKVLSRTVNPANDIEGKSQVGHIQRVYTKADSLADAIRNAGVRCETCEHWKDGRSEEWPDYDSGYCVGEPCSHFSGDEYSGETPSDFFCAHHSQLNEDEK